MQPFYKFLLPFMLAIDVAVCCGQRPSPVSWICRAAPATSHATTISITAVIPRGWHLYSQSIKAGGPTPTNITFEPNDDYILQGITVEKGEAVRYYDKAVEMEITRYSGTVTFSQGVMLIRSGVTIKGNIAYMTCNEEVCVRGEQPFTIQVPSGRSLLQEQ